MTQIETRVYASDDRWSTGTRDYLPHTLSCHPTRRYVVGMDLIGDRVRGTTVVQTENLFGREPQLGVEEQKHPILAEIHERTVSWLLPPAMPKSQPQAQGASRDEDVALRTAVRLATTTRT